MSTYKEIGDAFGRYCEVVWQLRGDARAVAQHLLNRIRSKGEIPEGVLAFCSPVSPRPEFDIHCKVEDAVRTEPQSGSLLIGFILTVRRGSDFWPSEHLRFDIVLKFRDGRYQVQLRDSRVMASFPPDETEETHQIMDEFAQAVVDEIFTFYDKHPDRLMNSGDQVIKGFSQIR